jgi:hypothetical protein
MWGKTTLPKLFMGKGLNESGAYAPPPPPSCFKYSDSAWVTDIPKFSAAELVSAYACI